ncbi:2953_t:CDS:2 [Rhizophagus irregularis]|nr:2953_t:CDS:2 [Rhizophagus irregularis]
MPKKKKQSRTTNNESYNNNNEKQKETSSTNQQIHDETTNSSINEVRLPPLEELSNTGFKILPIEISSQKTIFDSNSSDPSTFTSIHYCYFKSHDTLFISNLPIDSTEAHIKHLFQECGKIDRIIFNEVIKDDEFLTNIVNGSDNNEGGIEKNVIRNFEEGGLRKLLIPDSSAHIVFQNSEGLKKALEMTQKKRIWTIKDVVEIPSLGLSRWLQDYRLHRPGQIKLQEEVDEYMRKFEEAELERHKALEAKLNQPDEDGFIMVTRVGRRSANTDGTITVTAAKPEEIKNLKPKNKELTDFYRFQMRETKRNKLIDLRKKFEEDKEKIAKLKAARRFKPY